MAREVTILTPEQVEVKFELAGIGSRFVARLVDFLLQALVFLVLFFAIGVGFGVLFVRTVFSAGLANRRLRYLIVFVITNGYFLYFEAARGGQTPGKKMVGIRVIRDTGHPIDFRSALLRNVLRIVDEFGGMFPIGLVSIFFSSEYRRVGDYVGGTLVVKVGRKPEMLSFRGAADSPGFPDRTNSSGEGSFSLPPESMPLLGALTRDEYRAIRHFLDRRAELDSEVVRGLCDKIAEPIAAKLHVDTFAVGGSMRFLEAVRSEWEKRMIH